MKQGLINVHTGETQVLTFYIYCKRSCGELNKERLTREHSPEHTPDDLTYNNLLDICGKGEKSKHTHTHT